MVATKKKIHQKLLEVQAKLKAPKGQYNSFGRYNYRSAEDILEAVKPLLHEVGLLQVISDEVIEVGGRIYVKATIEVFDTESEDIITATALARESETKKGMDDSQVTGTASSYARKYALNGLYAIDDTKDADSNEYKTNLEGRNSRNSGVNRNSQANIPARNKPSKNEILKLFNELKVSGIDEAELKAEMLIRFKEADVKSTSDLTMTQYAELMNWIKER